MSDQFDSALAKMEAFAAKWLEKFDEAPVSTAIKIVILAWCVKQVRDKIWGR